MFEKPIPVSVITGFLGSGKTTLLSALLKQKEMANTAVIINEFGEIGLDHALIERSDENIVELQSGCICCTIRGDLQKTLLDLVDRVLKGSIEKFDRVVIETTGLADPAPIIHTLMTNLDLHRSYKLDSVITLVDAVNGNDTLDKHQESVKQAAMAERIVLSKTDIADEQTQETLLKRLKSINPTATIITGNNGEVSASELFVSGTYNADNKSQDVKEWLALEKVEDDHHHDHHHGHDHEHHHHDVNRHSDNIHAFAVTSDKPVHKMAFGIFLDALAANAGADLLRVKGIINIAGEERPAVIHGVQHIFHPPQWLDAWPDDDHRTKLVFITRDIPKEQVEGFYNALMDTKNKKSKQAKSVAA